MTKVLIVDDVSDAVRLVEKILSRKGYEVYGFTEEQDAIDFVRKTPVDLAILDIKLKKMSGIDVLRELKAIIPTMKVMMLTGYPTLDTARQALELGAQEYCVKPIEKEELESKVAALVGPGSRERK